MPRIPIEASEKREFTPESLANIIDPPVFILRSPDERHIRRYRACCEDDGLERFSDADWEAEKVRAIETLWTPEDGQPILDRFRTIMASLNQSIEISADDQDWIGELDETLFANHRALMVMRRKQNEWYNYAPVYAIGTFLAGWRQFDLPWKLEAGYVPTRHILSLLQRLGEIERAAIATGVEGVGPEGVAFLQLWTACLQQTRLDEDEEKNLPAPSQPSSQGEDSTTAKDLSQADGKSTAASSEGVNSSSSSAHKKTPVGA